MSQANPTDIDVVYSRSLDQFYTIPSPEKYYVYVVYRLDTGQPIYVGKGKGRRMFAHINDLNKGRVSARKKYAGMLNLKRNGVEMSQRAIIDELSSNAALEIESKLIDRLGVDNLLNSCSTRGSEDVYCIEVAKDAISRLNPNMSHFPIYRQLKSEFFEVIALCEKNLARDGISASA